MPRPLAPLLLLAALACERTLPPPQVVQMDPASTSGNAAVVEDTAGMAWEVVAEQDHRTRTPEPAEFRSGGGALRIITTARLARWPYVQGILVANVLSGPALELEVSARTEVVPGDTVARADTTVARTGPPPLYLFVPEHSALLEWRVVVQEARRRGPR